MATNWSMPALSQAWADFLAAIKGRDESLAKLDYTGDTNIPDGAIRWSASASRFEIWSASGSTWGALTATYAIDVDTVDGQHASAFAPVGHVGAMGSAHGVATTSVAGFMSAADKTLLNGATNAATANAIARRDAAGRLKAAAPSASDDVARKSETDAASSAATAAQSTANGAVSSLAAHKAAGGSEHPAATTSVAGFMSAADKQKLDGLVTPVFSASYESSPQAITAGGSLTLAHGLGAQPKLYWAYLRRLTAEHGYSVGDEVPVMQVANSNAGVMIRPDATNVNVRYGSGSAVFSVVNKTTGATGICVNANWSLIVRAWA